MTLNKRKNTLQSKRKIVSKVCESCEWCEGGRCALRTPGQTNKKEYVTIEHQQKIQKENVTIGHQQKYPKKICYNWEAANKKEI